LVPFGLLISAVYAATIVLAIRSFRSGMYLRGSQLTIRKVTYTRRLGLAQVKRFYVADSWVLRGAQCIGVESFTGKKIKCPSASCGGFDFGHYNAIVLGHEDRRGSAGAAASRGVIVVPSRWHRSADRHGTISPSHVCPGITEGGTGVAGTASFTITYDGPPGDDDDDNQE
jgi:hypothetical protein